jgi:hypothetical protein
MDDAPHPRILFHEVPEPALERLERFAGTAGVLGGDVEHIHASDWDVLVSFALVPPLPNGVHVLSIGGREFDRLGVSNGSTYTVRYNGLSHARAVVVPPEISGDLRSLIERTIVATAPPPPRAYFGTLSPTAHFQRLAGVGDELSPIAFMSQRRPYQDGCWTVALPSKTTGLEEWLTWFLEGLRGIDPGRFPGEPDWMTSAAWGTPRIRGIAEAAAEDERAHAAAVVSYEGRQAERAAELQLEVADAARGPYRLLTADGPELEKAVQDALDALGFNVRNMDGHNDAVTGAKLEDLRITDPAYDADWTCLVEVKGYGKGAKTNDVAQITGRPSVAFAVTEQRPPDAVWHVVNAWRDRPPSSRPVAIPNTLDLTPLAAANGRLIDTRDLFRAWRDVTEGATPAAQVRDSLRTGDVRWTWP